MHERHLRKLASKYSACKQFAKIGERVQKLKKQKIQDIFITTN